MCKMCRLVFDGGVRVSFLKSGAIRFAVIIKGLFSVFGLIENLKRDLALSREEINQYLCQQSNIQCKNDTENIIHKIIERCKNIGIDNETLKKMMKSPEKIRMILSIVAAEDEMLSNLSKELKNSIDRYCAIRKQLRRDSNYLNHYSEECLNGVERTREIYIRKLDSENLQIDSTSIIDSIIHGVRSNWLFNIVEAVKNRNKLRDNIEVQNTKRNFLKCFIAGSKKLEVERDSIVSAANDVNIESRKHLGDKTIECYSYKNFPKYFVDEGQQQLYNNFIKYEVDIIIFVLNGQLGTITREEFDIAVKTLIENDFRKPLVYVFSDITNNLPNTSVLEEIKFKLDDIKQYWVDYSGVANLKLEVKSIFKDLVRT